MNKQNWMGSVAGLGALKIHELILPGSHVSGADLEMDAIKYEITQDVACIDQIKGGVRALDLRLRVHREYTPDQPYRYELHRQFKTGRTLFGDVLSSLREFFKTPANAKEIIILDIQECLEFSPKEHVWLREAVQRHFGPMLIPASLADLTLAELWQRHPGRNVVIAYRDQDRGDFWPGVKQIQTPQAWPNAQNLKAYMDAEIPPGNADAGLHGIQFVCNDPKLEDTAMDLSTEVNGYFASVDLNSYIQRWRIIYTDYVLRSCIVPNCIHANTLRAAAKRG